MKMSRTIWLLSLISMFADMSSEMLYPIIPLYLSSIGVSVAALGFIEGLAEITAGITKGYFGSLSDHIGKRVPFIKAGYFLSALSKPLMVVLNVVGWIFFVRTIDRLGKGLRTAARDALLSNEANKENKASVFAFHRSWDTLGAIIGPAIVLAILYFKLTSIKNIFLWAALPGLLSLALIYLLKEKKIAPSLNDKAPSFFSFFKYWKKSSSTYKKIVAALCLFFLFNSSDVFLLLKSKAIINSEEAIFIILKAYILYNIVYTITSYPLGRLADQFGIKNILVVGLIIFSIVYFGFTKATTELHIYILFGIYGLYAAATEGIAKAWISNVSDEKEQATALGLFASCQSLSIMLASFMAGLVWTGWGADAVFYSSATVALVVAGYFMLGNWQKDKI
jgi:MFS family permease